MPVLAPAISLDQFTTFGDLLKYFRRRAGLTQRDLSAAVGYSDAQISRLELNQRLPDVATIAALFVPALNLEHKPEMAARLLELGARVRREDAPAPGLPPFKGLQYFDEADAHLFFGREAVVEKLVSRVLGKGVGEMAGQGGTSAPWPPLEAQLQYFPTLWQFLAVVGASGSGKSSIVRAGLLPTLRWNRVSADWSIHTLTPTAHPLEALATSLTREAQSITTTAGLVDDLARDPRSLSLFACGQLGKGTKAHQGTRQASSALSHLATPRLLLVVDQMEELFTLCRDEAERKAFVDNLLTACAEGGPARVIVTLRADFYSQCAPYANLREALAHQQEYIGPMNTTELRRAIEAPAKHGGWEFEAGLVDLILRDAGAGENRQPEPGALPLLSHALLEAWRRRQGHRLTLSGYLSSGGLRAAIAETAEAVLQDQLDPTQRAIARRIFLRLTELGEDQSVADTRRRAAFTELISSPTELPAMQAVLQQLADARLIVTEADTAEVAHEALIREWPTLRAWLDENREALRLHRRLTDAANAWIEAGRQPGDLYREARLAQALEWATLSGQTEGLSIVEREFLSASREHAEHQVTEREVQRQRELADAKRLAETARQLAEIERQRADEQRHYVVRMRARNRIIAAAGGMALVLAIVAGVFGLQSNWNAALAQQNLGAAQLANTQSAENAANAQAASNQADAQRDVAQQAEATAVALQAQSEREAREARSREWASVALNQVDADPERSVLIAMRAVSETYMTDGIVLPEAADALHRSIQASSMRLALTQGILPLVNSAFSPDGRRFLTIRFGNEVQVWDSASGRELLRLNPSHAGIFGYTSSGFDLDGQHLGFMDSDDQNRLVIQIWEAPLGNGAWTQVLTSTLPIGVTDVASNRFSRDLRYLVLGHYSGKATVWEVVSGRQLFTLTGHTGPVWDIGFSPDGTRIVTVGAKGVAKLWESATGHEVFTLVGHSPLVDIDGVNFSADGRYLITSSQEGAAKLWDVATGREVANFKHLAPMLYAGFSSDSQRVFTTSFDGVIKIWDVNTHAEQLTIASHNGLVYSVAFSPDGQRLLSTHSDGNALLWDAWTGQLLQAIPSGYFDPTARVPFAKVRFALGGRRLVTASPTTVWDIESDLPDVPSRLLASTLDTGVFWHVGLSADGKQLATLDVGAGDTVMIKIFDLMASLATQDPKITFLPFGYASLTTPRAGDFNSALTQFVAGYPDGRVEVWEIATAHKSFTLAGSSAPVEVLRFSPDGARLVLGDLTGMVAVFDLRSQQELWRMAGHLSSINDIDFSADGQRFVTTGEDGQANVWVAATGQLVLTLSHTGTSGAKVPLYQAAFSPDGKLIATAGQDQRVKVWDADTGETTLTLSGHTDAINGVAFSPDGKSIATAGFDGFIKLWDLTPQREDNTWAGQFVAANPDKNQIVALNGLTETILTVWDVSGAGDDVALRTVTLPLVPDQINSTTLNSDWSRVVLGLKEGSVSIWDFHSGREILNFTAHTLPIESVAVSPDGSRLVTGSAEGTAKLWDALTGQLAYTLTGQLLPTSYGDSQLKEIGQAINIVAFSPDGRRVATGDSQGNLSLWDAATGRRVIQMLGGHTNSIYTLAFNADGTQLATGSSDRTAIIWEVATGRALVRLVGHTNGIRGVAFSSDGTRLATGSDDGTAKIWDATTGQALQTISGDLAGIRSVRFSMDGDRLLANNNDGTIRLYLLDLDDLLALAHARVTRTLTAEECQQYLHVEVCP